MAEISIALLAFLACAAFGLSAAKAIGAGELYKEGMDYISRSENPVAFWRLVAWRGFLALLSLLVFAYAFMSLLVMNGVWKIDL